MDDSDSGEEEIIETGNAAKLYGFATKKQDAAWIRLVNMPESPEQESPDPEQELPEPEPTQGIQRDYTQIGYFNIDMDEDVKLFYKTKNGIKNVGAIGIFTHGSLEYSQIPIPLPTNLVVNEYNSSAESCYIHGPIFEYDDPFCYKLTTKAVSDLSGCMNTKDYLKSIYKKSTPKKYGNLSVDEQSCNLYLNVTELKGKIYSVNPVETKLADTTKIDYSNIIFMVAIHGSLDEKGNQYYKKVNLSLCTSDELKEFFKLTPDSELYNETSYETFCSERNKTAFITTTQLVRLIHFATTELELGHLNILDTSCSPIPTVHQGLQDKYGFRRFKPKKEAGFEYYGKRKLSENMVSKTRKSVSRTSKTKSDIVLNPVSNPRKKTRKSVSRTDSRTQTRNYR